MSTKGEIAGKINVYKEEIEKRNRKNFVSFTMGGMIITGAIFATGLLSPEYTRFSGEYFWNFLYFILLYFVARRCRKRKVRYIVPIYYAGICPVALMGIMLGTFLDPDQPALTIMVLMWVLTLFLIDNPERIAFFQMLCAVVFLVCCYQAKSPELFAKDMGNIVIYLCLGMGVNFFVLKERVENAENYCKVQEKSERDALTGIYNRGAGEIKIRKLMEKGVAGAFFLLDLDNFKGINDTYGHQTGDELINETAGILKKVFRQNDVVFRLGGDEFAVYAPGMISEELCEQRFTAVREAAQKIRESRKEYEFLGISIGCTIFHNEKVDFEMLYRASDHALYEAKESGKMQGKVVTGVFGKCGADR